MIGRIPCWFLSLLLHGAILAVGVGLGVGTGAPYEPALVTVTLAAPSGPLLAEFRVRPAEPEPEVETPRELPPPEDEVVPPLVEFVVVPTPAAETPTVEAPLPAPVPDQVPPAAKPIPPPPAPPVAAPAAAPSAGASGADGEIAAAEVDNPAPQYPLAARRRGLEAEVVVEIAITPQGTCGDVKIVENTGAAAFGDAALAAVRKWTFRPATLGGRPVGSSQRIRFVFKLKA